VAGNFDTPNNAGSGTINPDVSGTFTDQGNNLIGISQGSTNFVNGTNGNIVGTFATPVNPKLAALGDYGGTTKTHALLPGSVAINAGNNTGATTTDQRGATRIVGGTIDIGAYESAGFGLTPTGTPQSTAINTAFATPLQLQVIELAFNKPLPAPGVSITFTVPSSGASGTLGSGFTLVTDSTGKVTNPFTANGVGGTYTVTASSTGLTSATFSLTNIAPTPTPTTTKFTPNSEIARATQREYTPPTIASQTNTSTAGALGCGGGDTSALGNAVGGAIPAVAAMMNSGGGSVSVSMGGAFPSCGDGLAALPGNQSQLSEYLYQQVQQKIGREYHHLVHVSFSNSPGKATAIIQVDKAAQPAFLNQEGKQVFYIRQGEGQRILSPTEQEEYIRRNWQF
jgi:hypothetical protein